MHQVPLNALRANISTSRPAMDPYADFHSYRAVPANLSDCCSACPSAKAEQGSRLLSFWPHLAETAAQLHLEPCGAASVLGCPAVATVPGRAPAGCIRRPAQHSACGHRRAHCWVEAPGLGAWLHGGLRPARCLPPCCVGGAAPEGLNTTERARRRSLRGSKMPASMLR